MGFFDIFKKKKTEEVVAATPEVAQEIEQEIEQEEKREQEELNTGLEKTKEGFFSKLHRAIRCIPQTSSARQETSKSTIQSSQEAQRSHPGPALYAHPDPHSEI